MILRRRKRRQKTACYRTDEEGREEDQRGQRGTEPPVRGPDEEQHCQRQYGCLNRFPLQEQECRAREAGKEGGKTAAAPAEIKLSPEEEDL